MRKLLASTAASRRTKEDKTCATSPACWLRCDAGLYWKRENGRTRDSAAALKQAAPSRSVLTQIGVIHEAGEDSGCATPASSRTASGAISGCAKEGRGPSGHFGDNHSSFCCMIFCEYFAR